MNYYPVGAKVLVDGRHVATVRAVYPDGSALRLFRHYVVRFVGGSEDVAVAIRRVGVTRTPLKGESKC